ncbi:MAG: hypothetical protein HQL32_15250, partial [Planctomycetes bacterium]|nr:hypothetical protein [Planctomycetota bacterium]
MMKKVLSIVILVLFEVMAIAASREVVFKQQSLDDLKKDEALNQLKFVYVRHQIPKRLKNNVRTRMNALGFPSNHESHSSLPKVGYQCEIAIHDLQTGKSRTIYRPKGDYFVGHLDLHWSSEKLLFAQSGPKNWTIWEIHIDGSGLRQVSQTPSDVDCYEPIYLPNGDIIVSSNAPYQCVPCWHGNEGKFIANLYTMNNDGQKMRRLCFDQDHNSNPSVRNNGQVIYSRWDYTGMNRVFNRPLMSMNPDGTSQKALYGRNSYYPNALFAPRELPGTSGKYICVLSGYHQSFKSGQLVIVDTNRGHREEEGIVQRISGQGLELNVEYKDILTGYEFPQFLTPYPITNQKFLVSAWLDRNDWSKGVYLADTEDHMTLLYREKGYAFIEAIPLMPRKYPPAIPERVHLDKKDATIYLQDIHQGPGLKGVPRGDIQSVRVIAYDFGYIGLAGIDKIGMSGPWDAMSILGTVPVEKDGSAIFKVPANTPIALQPLDKEGKAVQLMRTWMTAMPGEVLSCVGCHENPGDAPRPKRSLASQKSPQPLIPWHGPPRGFDFAREVQPVLNKHCVQCHDGSKGKIDLRPEEKTSGYRGLVPGYFDHLRKPVATALHSAKLWISRIFWRATHKS